MFLKNKKINLIFIIIGLITLISTYSIETIAEAKIENENIKEVEQKIEVKKYFAIVEIPKIDLKREIFEITKKENNVEKNIYVHPTSIFPDKSGGNVILASHSGSAKNAYFKNLYELSKNDIINLYYKDNIYEYSIDEIEYQNKTGKLYLKPKTNNIILITCTKNNKKTQTIYYASLKNIKKIV